MAGVRKGIRNMSVTPGSGKDVKDTGMTSGQASKTKAWNAKNETSQYTTGKCEKGALGGMNTNS